jgi:DUF4097 and DUF4098 domain-containing protein YvlB
MSQTTPRATWSQLSFLLALAVCLAGCSLRVDADQFKTSEEKRFPVSGTPELSLATFDGSIEIRAWERPEVLVTIEKRARNQEAASKIEVVSEQSGNRISVEVRRPEGHRGFNIGFNSGSARLIASVPRQTNLRATTGDGALEVERITGQLELHTGDGTVRGNELAGEVRVHTGDGSIQLDRIQGSVKVESGDGSITVDGKLSGVQAKSGDGSISVKAREGSAVEEDWTITTGDGGVTLELPDRFDADLDAHTGDGVVRLNNVEVRISGGELQKQTVRGAIGAGGRTLRVRTGDGSINVTRNH